MAKTIDPGFQAAPYLGDSSHDPIEFVRRHNMAKYQQLKQAEDKRQAENSKTLNTLMFDVKAWEDQKGLQEIMGERDRIVSTFMDFSKRGMNLSSPKSTEEQMMFKGINDALASVKNKVSIWNEQKGIYDFYQKQLDDPKNNDLIDKEATMQNIQGVLGDNDILSRKEKLNNLIVKKPVLADVHKFVRENTDFITKPELITEPYTDPESGQLGSRQREVTTPAIEKKQEADLRQLFITAPKEVKQAVANTRKGDPTLGVMKDEDYFVAMYNPKFKQKMVDKLSGTGGGFALNFLGAKDFKTSPGQLRKEPLIYGSGPEGKTFTNTYEFSANKKLQVPTNIEGAEFFIGNTWQPMKTGGDVEGTLSYYDPTNDVFIFRTTSQNLTPYIPNNTTFIVPRSTIGASADNLPITVAGQNKKLKDLYGTTVVPKLKSPFGSTKIEWSKKPDIPKKK